MSIFNIQDKPNGEYKIMTREYAIYNHSYVLKLIEFDSNDTYFTGFAASMTSYASVTFPQYGKAF